MAHEMAASLEAAGRSTARSRSRSKSKSRSKSRSRDREKSRSNETGTQEDEQRRASTDSPDAGEEGEEGEEGEVTDPGPNDQHATIPPPATTSTTTTSAIDFAIPPLPDEPAPPPLLADDGWEAVWDDAARAFYFYNRFTRVTTWSNPRVPQDQRGVDGAERAPGTEDTTGGGSVGSGIVGQAGFAGGQGVATDDAVPPPPISRPRPAGGYDPAVHGDYDPTAWYAVEAAAAEEEQTHASGGAPGTGAAAVADYAATGAFNRFTGRWQAAEIQPDNHNDEAKSRRQMNAFFDVDAAANSHDGRSLKAERSGKKLSKRELKEFREKRKSKKEERRRAWLRD